MEKIGLFQMDLKIQYQVYQKKDNDYYSDPYLFFHDDIFELWYRFNPYDYNGEKSLTTNNIIYRVTSGDGINWSKPEIIFNDEDGQMYMSISVAYENGEYNVWYSNAYGFVVYRRSNDLKNWSEPKYINIEDYQYNVCHSEVKKQGSYYEMLLYSNLSNEIYLSKSTDMINFSNPCKINTDYFKKGDGIGKVYKSSYIKNGGNIYLYVPYDNIEGKKNTWSINFKKYNIDDFYNRCIEERSV